MWAVISRRKFLVAGGVTLAAVAAGGAGYVATLSDTDEAETQYSVTLGDGVKKALVVYGTKSGCTAGVAEAVGLGLAQAGWTADVRPAAEAPAPEGYDLVIAGSGVRVGQWHDAAQKWVAGNADALKTRPLALFTVCLRATDGEEGRAEASGYTDALTTEAGLSPESVGVFPGWNQPEKFSMVERLVMRAMKAPQGDFREPELAAEWARALAESLEAQS